MDQLAKRYAHALLELSEEKKTLEEDLVQTMMVRDALSAEGVGQFLVHPHISNADKQALLQKSFANQISEHLMGLLCLMIIKNRESLIVPTLTKFIDQTNHKLGFIEARVVSATTLTQKQLEAIHHILEKHLNMTIKMKLEVDPDVISGFYILVGDKVFDGTLRTELNQMKERLKRGGVAGAS